MVALAKIILSLTLSLYLSSLFSVECWMFADVVEAEGPHDTAISWQCSVLVPDPNSLLESLWGNGDTIEFLPRNDKLPLPFVNIYVLCARQCFLGCRDNRDHATSKPESLRHCKCAGILDLIYSCLYSREECTQEASVSKCLEMPCIWSLIFSPLIFHRNASLSHYFHLQAYWSCCNSYSQLNNYRYI